MTSKPLVHTACRPWVKPSFWMVLVSTVLLSSPGGAGLLEMTELIAHPQYYDRKEVVVLGTVSKVRPVTDKQGHPAFQFFLTDTSGTLKIVSRTEVQDGDQVIVEGTFSRRRQSGRLPVYNEVSANLVRPLTAFNDELIG